ncbi:MAG: hydroxymethylbilane synthase [Bacteroidota bacterium]
MNKKTKLKNTVQNKHLPFSEIKRRLIIGSRGSKLALWQANFISDELKKIGMDAEIKIIKTQGDIVKNLSLDKMEGKGFFTKEIEDALLKKEIDLAVHSHKDLPTKSPKGLMIAAVSEREDPSELLLINKNATDEKQKFLMKQNAVVGTSSARRKSQILAWRNDVKLKDLRGNIPTRIQKLRDKKYDAILIANAGVTRLKINTDEFYCEKLDAKEFIPAPAQGVLALQIRKSDKELFKKLRQLNCKEVAETIAVERKVLNLLEGGCQLPIGVHCEKYENENECSIFKVRVAIANKWNFDNCVSEQISFPRYFYFESKKTEGFAEEIVKKITSHSSYFSHLKSGMNVSVFISRDEKKNDFLKRCLEANGYKVFCQSLIEMKQIPIKKYTKCDWIFFSSKNAVKYFFEQNPDVDGVRFGAIGKTTAEKIRKYGKRANFIGNSNDTDRTGKKFSAMVGRQTVLFPQAKESMRTIQQQLRKEQVIDLVVYETLKKNDEINFKPKDINIFVFTSPSNVEAFFEKHYLTSIISPNGKKNKAKHKPNFVAMGNTTANALKKFGVKTNKQPPSFDDLGLVQAIYSI